MDKKARLLQVLALLNKLLSEAYAPLPFDLQETLINIQNYIDVTEMKGGK